MRRSNVLGMIKAQLIHLQIELQITAFYKTLLVNACTSFLNSESNANNTDEEPIQKIALKCIKMSCWLVIYDIHIFTFVKTTKTTLLTA